MDIQVVPLGQALRMAGACLMLHEVLLGWHPGPARADDRLAISSGLPGGAVAGAEPAPEGERAALGALGFPTAAPRQQTDAEVLYQGTPVPGARITLNVDVAEAAGSTCRWRQIEGPTVAIEDPTRPQIQLTVPKGMPRLVFLVTVKDTHGERSARVVVPIAAETGPEATGRPRADAGDDQIGLVGHRITLNGSRSTPANPKVNYRWVQTAGPKVADPSQQNAYFSFTPTQSGVHRFLLLISAENVISEPDEVEVIVGELAHDLDSRSSALGSLSPLDPLGQVIHLTGSLSGPIIAERVADVFDAIADRTDLYSTFGSLSSEAMRRLDAVIPQDPQSRLLWSQGVFLPLTQQTAAEMLPLGLDLRLPGSQQQALTPAQKEKLQKLFRIYAKMFRSRSQAR